MSSLANHRRNSRSLAAFVSLALTSAALSRPAAAQAPGVTLEVETVVVTGTHIRGSAEDAALPVEVISAQDIEKLGSPTALELIKSLNISNGVIGDTNQFDARAQGSEGAGTVNLRGLGPSRTLVLLNGRRLASNPFTGAPDTNLIPTAAIDRVEVLKDGAAATYGSDAIGGVVNFITRQDQEGLQLGADYKYIDGSNGDYTAGLSFGWQGDRSRALLAGGYQHRSELPVEERAWASRPFDEAAETGWGIVGHPSGFILRSTAVPGGFAGTLLDPQCAPLGGVPIPATASPIPLCATQFTRFDNITEEEQRHQLYGEYELQLGETTQLRIEGLYAHTDTPRWTTTPSYIALQAPSVAAPFYSVPFANPGVQTFIAQNPIITTAQGQTGPAAVLMNNGIFLAAPAFRPFGLGGNPLFGNQGVRSQREFEAFRVSAGLSGMLGEGLLWDVAMTYMEEEGDRRARDTVVSRFQQALNGFGGPSCTGTTPGANGCLWFNPFASAIPRSSLTGASNPAFTGAGDNDDPALIGWLFPEGFNRTTSDLLVVDALMSGATGLALGGGNVAWALGAQYRETGFATELDDLSNLAVTPCVTAVDGGPGCALGQPATGPYMFLGGAYEEEVSGDVYGIFGELGLPISDGFQAQLAARFEDYGGAIGSTFDPKLSLRWRLREGLALRGSIGTTFRGPPATEVGSGSVTSLQPIGGAGNFKAVDTLDNPRLEPESATTFNVGVLMKLAGFSASVDYWSFDFDNPIVVEPIGAIVDTMFPSGSATGNCDQPAYAGLQRRFTFAGGVCSLANISRVSVSWVNGAAVKTTGLDLDLRYDWDVPRGAMTLGATATRVLEYEVDAQIVAGIAVTGAFDAVGLLNYQTTAYPLPEWKGNTFVEYSMSAHNLRLVASYVGGYTDSRRFAINPSLGRDIDELLTYDLHYRIELPWETVLTATIDNLTNEDPPYARLELGYDPFTASGLGRTYEIGISKRL